MTSTEAATLKPVAKDSGYTRKAYLALTVRGYLSVCVCVSSSNVAGCGGNFLAVPVTPRFSSSLTPCDEWTSSTRASSSRPASVRREEKGEKRVVPAFVVTFHFRFESIPVARTDSQAEGDVSVADQHGVRECVRECVCYYAASVFTMRPTTMMGRSPALIVVTLLTLIAAAAEIASGASTAGGSEEAAVAATSTTFSASGDDAADVASGSAANDVNRGPRSDLGAGGGATGSPSGQNQASDWPNVRQELRSAVRDVLEVEYNMTAGQRRPRQLGLDLSGYGRHGVPGLDGVGHPGSAGSSSHHATSSSSSTLNSDLPVHESTGRRTRHTYDFTRKSNRG